MTDIILYTVYIASLNRLLVVFFDLALALALGLDPDPAREYGMVWYVIETPRKANSHFWTRARTQARVRSRSSGWCCSAVGHRLAAYRRRRSESRTHAFMHTHPETQGVMLDTYIHTYIYTEVMGITRQKSSRLTIPEIRPHSLDD